ncbi:unnamed protein product, partial [Oppiella nova]
NTALITGLSEFIDIMSSNTNESKIVLYVLSGISVLVNFIGLVAVYRESYVMTATYASMMGFIALMSIINTIYNPFQWLNTGLNFTACCMAIVYLCELQTLGMPTMCSVSTTQISPINPLILYVVPGPAHAPQLGLQLQSYQPSREMQFRPPAYIP